jgi:hypothetical protein
MLREMASISFANLAEEAKNTPATANSPISFVP